MKDSLTTFVSLVQPPSKLATIWVNIYFRFSSPEPTQRHQEVSACITHLCLLGSQASGSTKTGTPRKRASSPSKYTHGSRTVGTLLAKSQWLRFLFFSFFFLCKILVVSFKGAPDDSILKEVEIIKLFQWWEGGRIKAVLFVVKITFYDVNNVWLF